MPGLADRFGFDKGEARVVEQEVEDIVTGEEGEATGESDVTISELISVEAVEAVLVANSADPDPSQYGSVVTNNTAGDARYASGAVSEDNVVTVTISDPTGSGVEVTKDISVKIIASGY